MTDDHLRFTTELARLDASKLDRAERREIEGLYRAKEYAATSRRSATDGPTDPDDGRERGRVPFGCAVASLREAVDEAREEFGAAGYAVDGVEVTVDAHVVDGGAGNAVRVRAPGRTESTASGATSTVRFDLRPTGTAAGGAGETVPDLRDRQLAEARDALERGGFAVGEVTTEPGDVDGLVVAQSPPPGTAADAGEAIDLTVAERDEVAVPDVVGRRLEDATTALVAADLAVGEVDAETHDAPADAVVGQSPPPGGSLSAGARVDLTVSAGAPEEATADATDPTDADADTDSDATGPGLRAVDGVGPTYADRLREAGVVDLPTLLGRDVETVAAVTGAAPGRVEGWFADARRLLGDA
jgi:predicted flap endonuclease-1-like 5' DNA nuclease